MIWTRPPQPTRFTFGLVWLVCSLLCSPVWAQTSKAPPPPNDSPRNVLVLSPNQYGKLGTIVKSLHTQSRRRAVSAETTELRRQLQADSMPIPKGLGAIFVPLIIKNSTNVTAPSYLVFDQYGRLFATARTGKKAFVPPGTYTVKVGRRLTDLLPTYRIRVYDGKLTILRPRWAALVVRVVDERLVQFRGGYDVIHLKTRRSVGTGLGADDNLGEKVRAWLLPPGLYMIVRVGDSYLTRTNFFTVQINQGEVTTFRLVSDRNTGQFLGGGVVLGQQIIKRQGGWSWSLQLNGNFIWNQQANVPASNNGHTFSLTAFLFGRLAFNTNKHFFLTTLNSELGFTSSNFNFRKGSDLLSLQSIYIFRLLRLLGPYVRAGIETAIFPSAFTFSDGNNELNYPVSLYDCTITAGASGNVRSCALTKQINDRGAEPLPLGGYFDPFLVKEGLGISLQTPRTPWFDLRLLLGIGFRQESAQNVYKLELSKERCRDANKVNPLDPLDLSRCTTEEERVNDRSKILRFRKPSSQRQGLELALVATGFVSRFFTFTTEFDALSQFGDFLNFEVDWKASLILRLSHYASIIYRIRIRRDPAILANTELEKWYLDQSVVLSFSLLL